MKKFFTGINLILHLKFITILFILSNIIVRGQIPNSGFESWTNGNPDSWTTDNDPADGYIFVSPTTDSHSGNYALKAEVISEQGISLNPVAGIVFPYSQRPTNFSGYYKFTSAGSDSLLIIVSLGSSSDSASEGGGGSLVIKNTVNEYAQFNIPIYWVSKNSPDTCVITFTIYPNSLKSHPGTTYYLDDLSLTGTATSVGNNDLIVPDNFSLSQNYPNPFNPTTTIDYQIPTESHVRINVYDILGNKVAELINENKPTGRYSVNFNASSSDGKLSSGIYFYRIQAESANGQKGSFVQTKKLILLK